MFVFGRLFGGQSGPAMGGLTGVGVDGSLFSVNDKLYILVLALLICGALGCNKPETATEGWTGPTLREVAPTPGSTFDTSGLGRAEFDVHIMEIPAENVKQLHELWPMLYARPIRFKSFSAFGANSFAVGYGRAGIWDDIVRIVEEAGGHKALTVSLMLAENQAETVPVAGLERRKTVYYSLANGSSDGASVGPGMIGLRVRTKRSARLRQMADVAVYPVFSPPQIGGLPKARDLSRSKEHAFLLTAFGLKMSEGDMVVLGPREYVNDRVTLGGLVFSNPGGSLFMGEGERPEVKPAARVFVFVCKRVSY